MDRMINQEIRLVEMQADINETKKAIIRIRKRELEYVCLNNVPKEMKDAIVFINNATAGLKKVLIWVEECEMFFKQKIEREKQGMNIVFQ